MEDTLDAQLLRYAEHNRTEHPNTHRAMANKLGILGGNIAIAMLDKGIFAVAIDELNQPVYGLAMDVEDHKIRLVRMSCCWPLFCSNLKKWMGI